MFKGIQRKIEKNKFAIYIINDSETHNENNINNLTENIIESQLIMQSNIATHHALDPIQTKPYNKSKHSHLNTSQHTLQECEFL